MADQRLRFIAEWVDKGLKRGAKDASDSVKNVEKGLGSTTLSFKTFATTMGIAAAAAGAVAVALKKVFEAGKQGAQFDLMSQSVQNLGIDVDALQESVGGTIDEFSIMNATATLLAGTQGDLKEAFTDNADELLEIAKAANAVNPALGDTAFLYESLGRGIKRNSPLILDNLGLVIKVGEANERYAEQIGKSVEALSAEEKQIALLNEVLRSGNVLVDQAAGLNTDAADAFARFEAQIKDEVNAFKALVAEGLAPSIDKYTRLQALRDKGIIGKREYHNWTLKEIEAMEAQADSLERISQDYQGRYTPAVEEATGATEGLASSLDDVNRSILNNIENWQKDIEWIQNGGFELQQIAEGAMQDYADGLIDLEKAQSIVRVASIAMIEKMAEVEDLSLEQIQQEFIDLGYEELNAMRLAQGVWSAIQNVDGAHASATIDVFINQHGKIPKPLGGNLPSNQQMAAIGSSTGGAGAGVLGPQQAGGDFVVPPSFTNDSALLPVTAGERVRVDTASNTRTDALLGRLRERQSIDRLANKITEGILIGMS